MNINKNIFKNLPNDILYTHIFSFLENYIRMELKCYTKVSLFQSEDGINRWLYFAVNLNIPLYNWAKMHREEGGKRWATGLICLSHYGDNSVLNRHTLRKRVYDNGRIEYQFTKNNQPIQDVESSVALVLSISGYVPSEFLDDTRRFATPSFWAK